MLLNSYPACIVMVFGSAALAVLLLAILRKFIKVETFKTGHEVAGYLLSVAGTLYAVLLGLVVVDAMQKYQRAVEITEKECNNLADVFIIAQRLPEPNRSNVRMLCRRYAQKVEDTEWQQMSCRSFCPLARDTAVSLMEALIDFEPKSENEKALYPQMVEEASQFWQNRQARISMAVKGVPVAEWCALIFGAILIVFFTFLFWLENLRLQMLMTALVSMLIALNLCLLLLFAYPFSGDLAVAADSFKNLKQIFLRSH
ncbi:MAG: DUF4239 domain-containing protein [Candidatus Obscuribacterales bacterium]|nr:DUF4239 domain-containing protein [Candidatus Obscuribacterales bacterium]